MMHAATMSVPRRFVLFHWGMLAVTTGDMAAGARTFEDPNPKRMSADECWSRRQLEKEATQELREKLALCEGNPRKASGAPEATVPTGADNDESLSFTAALGKVAIADEATGGLCSWEALSVYPAGEWVETAVADRYFGPRPATHSVPLTSHDYDTKARACRGKKNWYNCPKFNHTRVWLPKIVKDGHCKMGWLDPRQIARITGRQLRVLLHGDSLTKGLYKSMLCQWGFWIESDEVEVAGPAPDRVHIGEEAWTIRFDGLSVQEHYHDLMFTVLTNQSVPRHEALGRPAEFDVIITNAHPHLYKQAMWKLGFYGPVIYVSHACARIREDRCGKHCSTNISRSMGLPTIDLCRLTDRERYPDYIAQWAPNGKVLNSGDPHICNPGPDDDAINMIGHMLVSLFTRR